MPRDGSNIYHRPVGTDAVTDTTIESTKYNSNVADVEQDLNLPRPIVAGGTGATNAHDAMIALSGEIAGQAVTNYDSFPFVAGSFKSDPGATGAPDAFFYYSGICHMLNDGGIMLEARAYNSGLATGKAYVREKWGTWSAWKEQAGSTADLDAAYVNVAGDTMTGDLTINAALRVGTAVPQIFFTPVSGATKQAQIYQSGDVFGVAAAGVGIYQTMNLANGNVNFASTTASSSPTTGALTVAGGVGVGGALNTTGDVTTVGSFRTGYGSVATGYLIFGNATSNYLYSNGAAGFTLTGGPLAITATTASTSPTTGALTVAGGVGVAGNVSIGSDITSSAILWPVGHKIGRDGATGGLFIGAGQANVEIDALNPLKVKNTTASSSPTTGALTVAGGIGAGGAVNCAALSTGAGAVTANTFNCSSGGPAYFSANATYTILQLFGGYYFQITQASGQLNYVANNAMAWMSNFNGDFTISGANAYKSGGGSWTATSDARIKNELGDYTRGLAEIAALRPIYYTYKGNDTLEAPAHIKQEDIDNKAPLAVPYPNSPHIHVATSAVKFAGLIAQEVEAIIPEMVTKRSAYIDGAAVDDLRDIDTTPLIFALINAVKELKARVEQLEAA